MTYQQRQSKIKRWGGGGRGLKIKLEIPSQSGKTSLRCGVMFFKKMGVGHAYNKINAGSPTDSLGTESIKVL